ncbi:MAG: hypothetical protein Ct9H90mP16_13890 [Candidatus Poseidoniales archaeon]|nr:MAG: hypothetical protein Ct9H90mP16_13890 [Candidatus Poseidoniales archaeon]
MIPLGLNEMTVPRLSIIASFSHDIHAVGRWNMDCPLGANTFSLFPKF